MSSSSPPPKPQPMNLLTETPQGASLDRFAQTLPYDVTKNIIQYLPPEIVESSNIPRYDKVRTPGTRSYKQKQTHDQETAPWVEKQVPMQTLPYDAEFWTSSEYVRGTPELKLNTALQHAKDGTYREYKRDEFESYNPPIGTTGRRPSRDFSHPRWNRRRNNVANLQNDAYYTLFPTPGEQKQPSAKYMYWS